MAKVVFRVNCRATRPGEGVFVIGTGDVLGNWNPLSAVPLSTQSDVFPVWSTAKLELPTGRTAEYKFLIQREDRKGEVRWETFHGNRSLDVPEPGSVLTTTSMWDDLKSSIMTAPCADAAQTPQASQVRQPLTPVAAASTPPVSAEAKASAGDEAAAPVSVEDVLARYDKEVVLLRMAESALDTAEAETAAACPLAVSIASREERRRNFSQSLFSVDLSTECSQSDVALVCETPKESEATTADLATDLPAAPETSVAPAPAVETASKETSVAPAPAVETASKEPASAPAPAAAAAPQAASAAASPAPGQSFERAASPSGDEAEEVLCEDDAHEDRGHLQDVDEAGDEESGDKEAHANLHSVSLKHIMSFSALTEMADAEEKEQARQGTKAQSVYDPYNLDVPVVIVSSEIAPWSKTGGLGLVAASYGYEFARKGHRTMAVSPKYKHYDNINYVGEARVRVDNQDQVVKYWHRPLDGCDYIFVEHPTFNRDGGLYNDNDGREYHDNLLRFTLLSLAAMEAPLVLHLGGRPYGDKVLFLANDWQAGLVPVYLNYKYRKNNCYTQSRAIYVIHNLGYQGQYHNVNIQSFFGIDHQAANDIKFHNSVNLCKGALTCSDRVVTVSPNYALEIQTPGGGFNLQDFVRAKSQANRLVGILNGIDDCWNPEIDTHIFQHYSVKDHVSGKRANKLALQRLLNLKEDPNLCIIGFVGRLTWQKGIDILGQCIHWMMEDTHNGVTGRVQLIMMGNGERGHGDMLRHMENSFRGLVCGYVGFDPNVEHQMMAGCDLFLMPSRYEPCGLPQMICQQYGTLPVVTYTGGLVDSVIDVSEGADVATGFHIPHLAADKTKETLWKAMELFHKRPDDFRQMQLTAMQTDFYWPKAMDEYEKQIDIALYEPACNL